MTPKEKANELVDRMYNVDFHDDAREIAMRYPHAIKCALVAVDEIIKSNPCTEGSDRGGNFEWCSNDYYWQQVKNEIKKL